MTIHGHVMTMIEVRIAELKARLSEYLRRVRRGQTLTVLDRDTPVARVVPYESGERLRVREPVGSAGSLHAVRVPPPAKLKVDVVEVLREEREG